MATTLCVAVAMASTTQSSNVVGSLTMPLKVTQGHQRQCPATTARPTHSRTHYDVVVVGAGGAGLRARSRLLGSGLRTAHHQVVSRPAPTGSAQGGILRLGNMHPDNCLAHVRHREGVGTARRPGLDRIHGAQRTRRGSTSYEHWACLLAHETQDLPSARSAA